jgi:ribosomal protein L11 methylase PrmA
VVGLKKAMDYKQLENLNKESLAQIEEYLKSKGQLKEDEHLKVVKAKEDWQLAWNKFMETLMMMERLEI